MKYNTYSHLFELIAAIGWSLDLCGCDRLACAVGWAGSVLPNPAQIVGSQMAANGSRLYDGRILDERNYETIHNFF